MTGRVLISVRTGETRLARVDSDGLVDIALLHDNRHELTGRLFLGRVQRVVPALDAAFVDIGQCEDGYLSASAVRNAAVRQGIDRRVHEGELLLVQAQGAGGGDKGLRLSTEIALRGRYLRLQPLSPPPADDPLAPLRHRFDLPGTLMPLRATPPDDTTLRRDAESLAARWASAMQQTSSNTEIGLLDEGEPDLIHALRPLLGVAAEPIVVDDAETFALVQAWLVKHAPDRAALLQRHTAPDLLERSGVEAGLVTALSRTVPLPGGGRLVIEPTAALVAIDVDSGSSSSSPDRRGTARCVNLEAVDALVRQIRLRRLGGLIAIDFVHMRHPVDRKAVTAQLEAALGEDQAATRLAPVPAFGLTVLNRQRLRAPLADWFLATDRPDIWRPEAAARRLLRAAEDALRHDSGRRALTLRAGPAVAAELGRGALLDLFRRRTGVLPEVAVDGTMGEDSGDVLAN